MQITVKCANKTLQADGTAIIQFTQFPIAGHFVPPASLTLSQVPLAESVQYEFGVEYTLSLAPVKVQ